VTAILVELLLERVWTTEINERRGALSRRLARRRGDHCRQHGADGDRQYRVMRRLTPAQSPHANYPASLEPDSAPGPDTGH